MKILLTGAAGFIGFHGINMLIEEDFEVVGIDNINAYYDVNLKYTRLAECGIERQEIATGAPVKSNKYEKYSFLKLDLTDQEGLHELFRSQSFDMVIHLAAQVGVRYSIDHPDDYVKSNLTGFVNILECCRHHHVRRLIYASSSSVYGVNDEVPFREDARVDHPLSLYAATKKSNELMAYTYSHLYGINTIGLRFFTVYGPWGRPDMAMSLFTEAILKNQPVKVFNEGRLSRDFTYVDDIVGGIRNIVKKKEWMQPWSIYNIGNSQPVRLLDFIREIENCTGVKALKEMLPMQPGDVEETWADVHKLKEDFGYSPGISVKEGVKRFVDWFRWYYRPEDLSPPGELQDGSRG